MREGSSVYTMLMVLTTISLPGLIIQGSFFCKLSGLSEATPKVVSEYEQRKVSGADGHSVSRWGLPLNLSFVGLDKR